MEATVKTPCNQVKIAINACVAESQQDSLADRLPHDALVNLRKEGPEAGPLPTQWQKGCAMHTIVLGASTQLTSTQSR